MNKNVILKQHFGHTLTVWVHCDGEQTLNRKMRSVWCPDTYSSNCPAHTLVKRIKTCIRLFHSREIAVGSFLKKCFVCFSFRRPGAPPCRWCRARRRQRARKHRLNWGWVHCSTALTHAVSKTTAEASAESFPEVVFICTVQFKMTCYWLFLSANEFFSRLTQWNLQ